MFVIIAPIQIKDGYKDRFIEEMIGDARGSVNDEPGCLQFDVIQDANDPNRIWLYEIYVDEDAFKAHTQAPHFIKWRDATADWTDGPKAGGSCAGLRPRRAPGRRPRRHQHLAPRPRVEVIRNSRTPSKLVTQRRSTT